MRKSPKKDTLTAERKREILSASIKVFAKYGYQDAGVDEVARLAGLGKGTVYRYFGSKENLFLSTLEWGLAALGDEMVEALAHVDGFLNQVMAALSTYMQFFEKNSDFYRIFVQERVWTEVKSLSEKWRFEHLSHVNHLTKVFREGIEKGYFKKVDPESAAYALLGIVNSLMYKWLTSRKKYPIRKELAIIEEIFFRGILTGRGNPPPAGKRNKERK